MFKAIRRAFRGEPEPPPPDPQAEYEHRLLEWREECQQLSEEIRTLESYEELADETDPDCPIITKKGEELLAIVNGARLTETRRGKTTYRGSSHGVSIRISKNITYRPSIHSGSVEQAPEFIKIIDGNDGDGVFVVTNKRAVFRGDLHTREWLWSKIVSVTPEKYRGSEYVLLMPVENRQRVTGVYLGKKRVTEEIMRRVMFGIAVYRGLEDQFIERMKNELEELKSDEPQFEAVEPQQ